MKRLRFLTTLLLIQFALTNISCVSISMQKNNSRKSEDVKYEKPFQSQYEEIETNLVDKSWRHTRTGNTISYLSDCGGDSDPSLKNIFQGIISDIENVEIIEESDVFYNSREAYHTLVQGNIDGVLTRFELMIFKKNSCTYILTYTAVATAFASGQKDFQRFVKGFVAP